MSDEMTLDELRLAIAERLGYRYYWYDFLGECHLRDLGMQNTSGMTTFEKRPDNVPINTEFVPEWPTEMAAADELLDDLDKRGLSYSVHGSANEIECVVYGNDVWEYNSRAKSATGKIRPEAISRAWLKATE